MSFMSTVRLADLAPLVAPAAALARAIPMPPMARRRGPCAVFPAGAAVAPVLRRAATVVELVRARAQRGRENGMDRWARAWGGRGGRGEGDREGWRGG